LNKYLYSSLHGAATNVTDKQLNPKVKLEVENLHFTKVSKLKVINSQHDECNPIRTSSQFVVVERLVMYMQEIINLCMLHLAVLSQTTECFASENKARFFNARMKE